MSFKELPLMSDKKGTVLFYPYIPKNSASAIKKVLSGRWIGQGPLVDKFEKKFSKMFAKNNPCIATGAGTDALHLAYILAGLKFGDEVIAPVYTCTATNIPFLYMGVKIKFADVDPITMNISVESVKKLITSKTKAIVCTHYGGLPCDMDELKKIASQKKIPIVEDAAHALGATYKNKPIGSLSEFTMFSFQAIKHITTGDGGMLCIKNKKLLDKARRIRWFGIDREGKQKGTWKNDIFEVGYKYQMTDIGASIGIESLKNFNKICKRELIINTTNDIFKGEDTIISAKSLIEKYVFHIRFHLMPQISTTITESKKNLIVRTKKNKMWLFKSDKEIMVEKSIYVENDRAIETSLIVIGGITSSLRDKIKWSLENM